MPPRQLTPENFRPKAEAVHGNDLDFSKAVYVNSSTKVIVICPTHGEYLTMPWRIIYGSGCKKCNGPRSGTKLNADNFHVKMSEIHGDALDFSLAQFKSWAESVIVICPVHGQYKAMPGNLLQGSGCRPCVYTSMALSQEEFEKRSESRHPGQFNYGLAKYVNIHTPVILQCRLCDRVFERSPASHMAGAGCPSCGERKHRTQEEFIAEVKEVHGADIDTSDSIFRGMAETVKVTCCKCKTCWDPIAGNLLNGHGCPICNAGSYTSATYAVECQRHYGSDKYDYSESEYRGMRENITIKCKLCGHVFSTNAGKHMTQEYGCPCQRQSRGENAVQRCLEELKIPFQRAWPVPETQLVADFYLPQHRAAIEFDGQQHFKDVIWFQSTKELVQERDRRKDLQCFGMGLSMLRIHWKDKKHIHSIVETFIARLTQLDSQSCLLYLSREQYN